jgi:hypothetical protein
VCAVPPCGFTTRQPLGASGREFSTERGSRHGTPRSLGVSFCCFSEANLSSRAAISRKHLYRRDAPRHQSLWRSSRRPTAHDRFALETIPVVAWIIRGGGSISITGVARVDPWNCTYSYTVTLPRSLGVGNAADRAGCRIGGRRQFSSRERATG